MWKNVVEDWQINSQTDPADLEAKQPHVDNGLEIVDPSRYYDKSFMQLEWERLWTRAWLIAGIETDIPDAGDYFVFRVGRESILVVRQQDGSVKAMYNVCAHRGNQIVQNDRGSATQFPPHGVPISLAVLTMMFLPFPTMAWLRRRARAERYERR